MPTTFGKYVLHARIAVGGMAEVWRATLPGANGIDKSCVLKRILPRFAGDDSFVRMFLREAKLSIALQHGNIVSVFDFGQSGDTYYLAMEYVAGHDLGAALERLRKVGARFPVGLALLIATELSRGLAYAHDKTDDAGAPLGIVHRDVSPSNVLLSSEGEVKLVDFGIAKAQTTSLHTNATDLKGKIPYMSPEQARLEELDARADVWAAGVVLYEMLAGRRPYEGRDHFEVIERIRAAAPIPPLRSLRAEVPDELDAVVRTCLSARPADRYENGRALQVALSRVSRHEPALTGADLRAFLAELFGGPEGPSASSRRDLPYADTVLAKSAGDARDTRTTAVWPSAPPGADTDTEAGPTLPGGRALHQAPTAILRPAPAAPPREGGEAVTVPGGRRRSFSSVLIAGGLLLAALALALVQPWSAETAPRVRPPPPSATGPAAHPPPPPPRAFVRPAPAPSPPAPPETARAPEPGVAHTPSTGPAPREAAPPTGILDVNATPWAEVWVDGRRAAESTPAKLRLTPGTHRVRLTNPELGVRGDYQVQIGAGTVTRLAPRLR